MSNVEALDMKLHGNRSDIGMEVEEAMGCGSQPLTKVLGIGN